MKSTLMPELTSTPKEFIFDKYLNLLGLSLSESEMNQLNIGDIVSLEKRDLSEIGSVFILATALSKKNFGKSKKSITFQDLPTVVHQSNSCSGIPLFCWDSTSFARRCLYLTLVNGIPALRIGSIQ